LDIFFFVLLSASPVRGALESSLCRGKEKRSVKTGYSAAQLPLRNQLSSAEPAAQSSRAAQPRSRRAAHDRCAGG